MTNPVSTLGSFLRKPRFNANQALLFFAIPATLLVRAQSHRRDEDIAAQFIGSARRLDTPIEVHTPEGICQVSDYDAYKNLVFSIPLPNSHSHFVDCFGVARKLLLVAWYEIASGLDITHAIEIGRFSAFAALDATLENHNSYKRYGTFRNRLKHFTELAENDDLLKNLSSASGYQIEELRDPVIQTLAITRNVTAHCKGHTERTETRSSHIDLRPIHLASAIISELQP
jgi:hypothetical protein